MHDPRLTPARPDLAAKYLEGKVKAARFVTGEEFCVRDAIAPLRGAPSADATLVTQALKGERVTIYDRDSEGFAWGQLNGDGYVGWIPDAALVRPAAAPTHKVTALRTFAFPGPSIKLPPVETLPMGARVTVAREDGALAGTPYLWGGKSSLGIDCSGLVQISLNAAGTGCPRDSDMQQDGLGRALSSEE